MRDMKYKYYIIMNLLFKTTQDKLQNYELLKIAPSKVQLYELFKSLLRHNSP